MALEFLDHLLTLLLDTAIWLLFGLILAALLKSWIPAALVERWLSGSGSGAVLRAAIIGAPLPLCSCGVLPTAIGLRRSGASKPATVAFLVATPETGIDSISVTYALLGPVMAIVRPLAALISAITSGLMVLYFDTVKAAPRATLPTMTATTQDSAQADIDTAKDSACCQHPSTTAAAAACCSSHDTSPATSPTKRSLMAGLQFAVVDILDDIAKWLAIGLVLAALTATLIEPTGLAAWGSGFSAMLIMLVAGLPLYICATASTPLAAALLTAGMSPGAVLVFLLVGPATNIAAIGILSRELGPRALALYLAGISVSAVTLGLCLDTVLSNQAQVISPIDSPHSNAFLALQWLALVILLVLSIKPLRQRIWPTLTTETV